MKSGVPYPDSETIFMDTSDVIARLIPQTEAASNALRLPHNRSFVIEESSTPKEEQITPAATRGTTPAVVLKSPPILLLTYSRLPYDGNLGFVFGSWDEECEILLEETPSASGISRRHFRINFSWDSGRLILVDMSSNGTVVTSQVMRQTLTLYKSSLPLASGDVIQAGVVRLQVIIPAKDDMEELREQKWNMYREQYLATIPKKNGVPRLLPQAQTVMEEGRISLLDLIAKGSAGKVR